MMNPFRTGYLFRYGFCFLLSLSLCVGARVCLLAEYRVVLKDGKIIEALAKPVSMEGYYRFTDIQNRFHAIPIQLIDLAATQTVNTTAHPKLKASRTLTNEDVSSKAPSLVSSGQSNREPAKPGTVSAAGTGMKKGEAYWRSQAKRIRDQMLRIDNRIKELNEKTRAGKSDGVKIGFDTYNQVIYANFESELKELEREREKLQKEMVALEEEARKSGALPGWLR